MEHFLKEKSGDKQEVINLLLESLHNVEKVAIIASSASESQMGILRNSFKELLEMKSISIQQIHRNQLMIIKQ